MDLFVGIIEVSVVSYDSTHTNVSQIVLQSFSLTGDSTELDHRLQYVDLCALFVLQYRMFHTIDKKVFRQVWDAQRKVYVCTNVADILFIALL